MKNALVILASIAILATIGLAIALKEWADQYIAVSMLTVDSLPNPQTIVHFKAIAPKRLAPNYAQMTIRELKALCKGSGVKNWSRLTKAALIAALSSHAIAS